MISSSPILRILTIFHLAVSSVSALTDTECITVWEQMKQFCGTSSGTCPEDCLTKLNEHAAGCAKDWGRYIFGYTKARDGVCADVYMDWYMDQRSDDCQDMMDANDIRINFCLSGCSERCQQLADGMCDHCPATNQQASYKIDRNGCGSCPGFPTSPTAPSPTDSSPTDDAPTPAVAQDDGDAEDDGDSDSGSIKSFFLGYLMVAAFSAAVIW